MSYEKTKDTKYVLDNDNECPFNNNNNKDRKKIDGKHLKIVTFTNDSSNNEEIKKIKKRKDNLQNRRLYISHVILVLYPIKQTYPSYT